MVIVLAVLLFGWASHADVILTGRAFESAEAIHQQGKLDISFARGGHLLVDISDFKTAGAHKAQIALMQVRNSTLADADFSSARLRQSYWSGVTLGRANFQGADLRQAQFQNTVMTTCTFDGADLRGADLQETQLGNCTWTGARYNEKSRLPFDWSAAERWGMIYVP